VEGEAGDKSETDSRDPVGTVSSLAAEADVPLASKPDLLAVCESDLLAVCESDLLAVSGIALLIASGRAMPIGFMCAISGFILGRK
jgi:hypothetical protein